VLDSTELELPVSSGVPLGTVLSPLLSLVYINHLPNRVRFTVCMFADDCPVYREIHDEWRPITSSWHLIALRLVWAP